MFEICRFVGDGHALTRRNLDQTVSPDDHSVSPTESHSPSNWPFGDGSRTGGADLADAQAQLVSAGGQGAANPPMASATGFRLILPVGSTGGI